MMFMSLANVAKTKDALATPMSHVKTLKLQLLCQAKSRKWAVKPDSTLRAVTDKPDLQTLHGEEEEERVIFFLFGGQAR